MVIVGESYLKRYYSDGYMDIVSLTSWSQTMMREWHDDVEGQIINELNESPETNLPLATDILQCFEYHPEIMVYLINDMINSAIDSLIYHLDNFIYDTCHLKNTGIEFRSVALDGYGSIILSFNYVSLNFIQTWQEDLNSRKGGLYALI